MSDRLFVAVSFKGPWHLDGAPCAPAKPAHSYHVDPAAGAGTVPVVGDVCPVCCPDAGRQRAIADLRTLRSDVAFRMAPSALSADILRRLERILAHLGEVG